MKKLFLIIGGVVAACAGASLFFYFRGKGDEKRCGCLCDYDAYECDWER